MNSHVRSRTTRLVKPLLHLLELRLELLVLHGKATVGVLQQRLEVRNTLVTREELALRDARLLLERRVLIDKLSKVFSADDSGDQAKWRSPVSAQGSTAPGCAPRTPSSSAAPCCCCCG